jgi:hypothetical protein
VWAILSLAVAVVGLATGHDGLTVGGFVACAMSVGWLLRELFRKRR